MLTDYHSQVPGQKPVTNSKLTLLEELLLLQPSSSNSLANDIIKDKIKHHKTTLNLLLKWISERESAKKRNISSLASEIIGLQSQLYFYLCHTYPIFPDNKRKGNIEKSISDLENHKRREEIECWKDTLELWQEVLKIAAEYMSMVKKAKVILFEE